MGIMVRPFQKEDLLGKWIEDFDFSQVTWEKKEGVYMTVIEDGEIIACGGVHLYDSENGEVWFTLAKRVKTFPLHRRIFAVRSIYDVFRILIDSFPGVTLYCRVKEGFREAEKFANRFGFNRFIEIKDNYRVYQWQ